MRSSIDCCHMVALVIASFIACALAVIELAGLDGQ